jgi:uncharacterized membrane protein
MSTNRLEAFSDGVIAILITIMVLELHVPHSPTLSALGPTLPTFLAYVLSFVLLGIYWNNHHHMIHATKHVDGGILWANLHLLFWLSLVPFTTAWMGNNGKSSLPTAAYGVNLVLAAVAYTILQSTIIRHGGMTREVAEALSNDRKGQLSIAFYLSALPLAFVHPALSWLLYATVALMWLVPDRRIESRMHDDETR